jgi:hypothetical protein
LSLVVGIHNEYGRLQRAGVAESVELDADSHLFGWSLSAGIVSAYQGYDVNTPIKSIALDA